MAPRARSKRKRKQSPGNGNYAASPSVRSISERERAWRNFYKVLEPWMDEMEARMKKSKSKSTTIKKHGGGEVGAALFLLFCFTMFYWLVNFGPNIPLRDIFDIVCGAEF